MTLVLASKSSGRLNMLRAAGLSVEALPANVDEDALKDGLKAEGISARNLADALAEAKALKVSRRISNTLVLGADQLLELEDGTMLDKPYSKDDAKQHLILMSGKTHKLFSAAVIAENGKPVWRAVDKANMSVRILSDEFINQYVEAEWDNIRHCVGCYEIEGRGAQLFSKIEGCQFTIIGLPMLQTLDFLRIRGELTS